MGKVYQRQFDPKDKNSSLALIAKHIPKGSRVLDIGCGVGELGRYLKEVKDCYVVGIEYSQESIQIATQKLDKAVMLDLNKDRLESNLFDVQATEFDVIVIADVLEHIYSPERVLESAKSLLSDSGKLLISIPNAGYVGALIGLYDDSWHYREEGILDRTHIRFYTQKTIAALLDETGFQQQICDRVSRDLLDSEFTQRIDSQADAVRNWLLAKPEGSTYQFIIEARPNTQTVNWTKAEPAPPMSIQHIVKLYWQPNNESEFTESNTQLQRGMMGEINRLSFDLPTDQLAKWRIDFADRKGVYFIKNLRVYQTDGELLWSCTQSPYTTALHEAVTDSQDSLPMRVLANSAQAFLLMKPEHPIATVQDHLRIVIEISSPISELNTAFYDAVPISAYREMCEQYASTKNQLENNCQRIQSLEKKIIAMQQQVNAHQRQEKQWDVERQQYKTDINRIHQSASWRYTVPIRNFIRYIRRSS
ncbi:class I SAM-dependent methyltransferase [Ostreibacterium oceani]|uniref:Methyltransferase domain-containing protein n=1 Tax=Ostreibacterium oceani TaxID=2654998 RepID=A0A6N7EXY1_9GAMM|nr:class I SAM-dependent methyltransferase [Ostreibacterium oceani]MPV85328.1 methyltransferase domain-containing protein [Ostreibacterium oceani]